MKKILLIMALALFFCSTAKTQDYRPMAVEDAHWIVGFHDATFIFSLKDLWEYYAHGDTVLNGLSYKKIYQRDLLLSEPNWGYPPFEPTTSFTLFALLRDDIAEQKVYAITYRDTYFNYSCPIGEEYLLYEFPFNIGDTVSFCILDMYPHDFFDIEDIYETELFGTSTKTYQLISGHLDYYEGIGSLYGLFEDMMQTVKSSRGSFAQLEYYCLESEGTCEGLFVSLEDYKELKSDIKLIPNPAKDNVRIQLLQPESITGFQICNLYGNVLYTQTTNETNEYTLDVNKLATVVYMIYFYHHKQIVQVKKLIVSR